MEKKISLFVSKRNPMTWIAAIFVILAAVARITLGAMDMLPSGSLLTHTLLPLAAYALYVMIALIWGREMFYKTAIPVWMIALHYAFRITDYGFSNMVNVLFWIVLLFYAILYTDITAGRGRHAFWLLLLNAIPLVTMVYLHRQAIMHYDWISAAVILPDVLMSLGLLLMSFAIRIHTDGAYHPTWGDRIDGRRIRTLSPMAQITMYFQWERNICSNLFEESIEITHIDRYIRQKRKEGYTDFGITHVLLAGYVRAVAKYPQLNRFIAGQKVYTHGDDIQYCMVIKKNMSVDSPDTSIKVHLTPYDTAIDVYNKLNAAVEAVKQTQELDSSLDNLIQYLNLIPGVFLKFTVWLLKFLDYFGLLPKFLLELSPFHGSLFFTSMGSLGIQPIYHHLYDFGNLPVFGAFGCKRRANEVLDDGTVVSKKYVDIKFVLDERIVDGYYYATFFKHYRRILAHPEILDNPPEEVIHDID